MLVIHPKDRTTEFLNKLYLGRKEVNLLTQDNTSDEVRKAIHHLPSSQPIYLLGHGSVDGLFSRRDDTGAFDRIIVGHKHAYYLQRRGNIVGIFCNANLFAEKEHLHGLFTGMIISEMSEAQEYNVETSQEELDRENILFVQRLVHLLNDDTPLRLIPDLMREMDTSKTALTRFNYERIYFL